LAEAVKAMGAEGVWDRVEAVDEVRRMGEAGRGALEDVRGLLDDPQAAVRLHAAAAVLALEPGRERAREVLITGLRDESADVRREAARCLGRLGKGTGFAVPALVASLDPKRGEDEAVAVIEAIGWAGAPLGSRERLSPRPSPGAPAEGKKAGAAVGRSADASAEQKLIALLDDVGLRVYAAEALGRLGATAALPKLAGMLTSGDADVQWAAARAMVLIGGEGARPVVPFLIKRLEVAPRGRELYQLTWLLGLLGPVAREALPALAEARARDNELASMAMWAVTPEAAMPWQLGYRADRDCDLWLFADYIERMGERSGGAAVAMAEKVVNGRAGRVPSWGYHLLVARADAAVPVLVAVAREGSAGARRMRAVETLGGMGPAAKDAIPALKELAGGADEALAAAAREALEAVAHKP
jgi:HEAT repeat protein